MTADLINPEDDEWMAAMRRGDFARAWEISDEVLREPATSGNACWELPRHEQPIWDGTPLTGKRVLVRCYHGLGDTIQFIRFAAPLRAIAREIIVWVQPSLMELVRTAHGVDKVMPLHDGSPGIDYDVDIEVMELAHALRVQPDTIPVEIPYLFPPRKAAPSLGPEFNVGIVWQAGGWDPRRSIPAQEMAHLAGASGIRLHSLQRGPARDVASELTSTDISTDDICEAGRRIRQLDLIVCVDTMMAHLAGAIGLPVWLLLHSRCDWRWTAGARSVWYPTMQLFRQTKPNDWTSVIASVRDSLIKKAAERIPA
jgi:hypothetical protein